MSLDNVLATLRAERAAVGEKLWRHERPEAAMVTA